MGVDRQPPDYEVPHPGAVERLNNPGKVRGFHQSWEERQTSNAV